MITSCCPLARPPSSAHAARLGAALIVTVGWLAGCGGGGSASGGPSAVGAAPTGSAASAAAAAAAPASEPASAPVSVPASAPVSAPVYVVGNAPSGVYPGAVRHAQLTDVPWSTLAPGSAVYVAPGTYAGPVTITATGSAAAPIRVDALDAANPPVLTDSIDLQQSAWVQIAHVTVQSPRYAGVVIRRGSHHVVVADSLVRGAPMGIDITDGAGTAITLLRNRIEDSATNGIGVDGVNADSSDRSVIQDNVVLRSGHHGIELRGSNYRIERNDVSQSGLAIAGTSGIHVFSAAEGDGTGSGNLVRYNLSHDNLDSGASDGNGIQLDRWCDRNVIAFNVAWNNDGAGIAVYDANDSQVYANTLRGNGRDPGGTHGSLGELVLNSSSVGGPRPAGNSVYDNVLVSSRAAVPALYVDTNAVQIGSNRAAPNLLYNAAGGTVLRWTDSRFLSSLASINAATGSSDNLLANPSFADASQPQAEGLRLTAVPGPGSVALVGQTDRLGQIGVDGATFFGAYFSGP